MSLLHLLKQHLAREVRLSDLADEVADRCFEAVWGKVQGRVLVLAPAEARGYVRARARGLLREQLAVRQISCRWEERVFSMAMEMTLRRVANQTHAVRVQGTRRQAA